MASHEFGLLAPGFDVQTVRRGASLRVIVSGEVDLQTAPLLEEELQRCSQAGIGVVVDLEEVEFMDCAGLRVLLAATNDLESTGFSVTPGSPQVQKLLALAGIGATLEIAPRPVARSAA